MEIPREILDHIVIAPSWPNTHQYIIDPAPVTALDPLITAPPPDFTVLSYPGVPIISENNHITGDSAHLLHTNFPKDGCASQYSFRTVSREFLKQNGAIILPLTAELHLPKSQEATHANTSKCFHQFLHQYGWEQVTAFSGFQIRDKRQMKDQPEDQPEDNFWPKEPELANIWIFTPDGENYYQLPPGLYPHDLARRIAEKSAKLPKHAILLSDIQRGWDVRLMKAQQYKFNPGLRYINECLDSSNFVAFPVKNPKLGSEQDQIIIRSQKYPFEPYPASVDTYLWQVYGAVFKFDEGVIELLGEKDFINGWVPDIEQIDRLAQDLDALSRIVGKNLKIVSVYHGLSIEDEPINVGLQGNTETEIVLSNFAHSPFTLDDKHYESVESFWQSLYAEEGSAREKIAAMQGRKAKNAGRRLKEKLKEPLTHITYQGSEISIGSAGHHDLMRRALRAKFEQNEHARELLLDSGNRPITHYLYDFRGKVLPDSTSIPRDVFTAMLRDIREELREAS